MVVGGGLRVAVGEECFQTEGDVVVGEVSGVWVRDGVEWPLRQVRLIFLVYKGVDGCSAGVNNAVIYSRP